MEDEGLLVSFIAMPDIVIRSKCLVYLRLSGVLEPSLPMVGLRKLKGL